MHFQVFFGFVLAIFSMILYGLYMVPRRQSSISPGLFIFWMGVGIFFGSTVIGLIFGGIPKVNYHQGILIFISGIVWATGSHCYSLAVKSIGLSRSTPIKNTSAFLGTLTGILVFHEIALNNTTALLLTVLGSIAVTASATLLGQVQAPRSDSLHRVSKNTMIRGVLYSLWAAVAYSVYTIPMKIVYAQGVTPYTFLMLMGWGCFLGMVIIAWCSGARFGREIVAKKDKWMAQSSGVMFAIGSVCANVAVKHIGVAITWPLTKNTVVAVLFGVIVLKEVDVKHHKERLVLGSLLSIIGSIFLALAMIQR